MTTVSPGNSQWWGWGGGGGGRGGHHLLVIYKMTAKTTFPIFQKLLHIVNIPWDSFNLPVVLISNILSLTLSDIH